MRNCPNCGAPIADNNAFCGNCGTKVEIQPNITFQDPIKGFNPDRVQDTAAFNNQGVMQYQQPMQQYQQYQQPAQQYYPQSSSQDGLITAIKVFMILSCVFSSFFLFIPLLWTVPMTVIAIKKLENRQPLGVAFKICTLLFVGIIPGILMLVLNDEVNNYPQY